MAKLLWYWKSDSQYNPVNCQIKCAPFVTQNTSFSNYNQLYLGPIVQNWIKYIFCHVSMNMSLGLYFLISFSIFNYYHSFSFSLFCFENPRTILSSGTLQPDNTITYVTRISTKKKISLLITATFELWTVKTKFYHFAMVIHIH